MPPTTSTKNLSKLATVPSRSYLSTNKNKAAPTKPINGANGISPDRDSTDCPFQSPLDRFPISWRVSTVSTNQNTSNTNPQSAAPPSSINHSEALSESTLPSLTQ